MKTSNAVVLIGSLLLSGLASATCVPSQFYNASVPRWEWWPNPGPLANGDKGQYLNLSSGVDLWYTTFGKNSSRHTPVLLLHGGTVNFAMEYFLDMKFDDVLPYY